MLSVIMETHEKRITDWEKILAKMDMFGEAAVVSDSFITVKLSFCLAETIVSPC